MNISSRKIKIWQNFLLYPWATTGANIYQRSWIMISKALTETNEIGWAGFFKLIILKLEFVCKPSHRLTKFLSEKQLSLKVPKKQEIVFVSYVVHMYRTKFQLNITSRKIDIILTNSLLSLWARGVHYSISADYRIKLNWILYFDLIF